MKFKKLTKEQILISLDRLTRFKYTKDKYLRVYTETILSNLIEPQYKKRELLEMEYDFLSKLFEYIFNNSLENSENINLSINKKIADYENTIFYNDIETQKLLNNHINYNSAIQYIDSTCPINLQWLKSLFNNIEPKLNRELHCLKFPIEKVLLVEGITEEILLPAFSRYLGFDFYKLGIQVIPAGGKNQVVKMYYKLIEELKLPIFLLLDKDAEENIKQIKPKLRPIDKVHLVACGEFEDLLPKSLIVKSVNYELKNFTTISEVDLLEENPQVKNLENIFKTKGLHEFKKAEFAKNVRKNISSNTDISSEIVEIIKEIFNNKKTLDSKFCS